MGAFRTDADIIAHVRSTYVAAEAHGVSHIALSREEVAVLLAASSPPVQATGQGAAHYSAAMNLAITACMAWHTEQGKTAHPLDAAIHEYCARELAKLKVPYDDPKGPVDAGLRDILNHPDYFVRKYTVETSKVSRIDKILHIELGKVVRTLSDTS